MKINSGKFQRAEEMLTYRDRLKIHELYHKYFIDIDLICERFGLDEEAIKAILNKPVKERALQWQVRWYDSSGEKHTHIAETFSAAKEFHAALQGVEWTKIERV